MASILLRHVDDVPARAAARGFPAATRAFNQGRASTETLLAGVSKSVLTNVMRPSAIASGAPKHTERSAACTNFSALQCVLPQPRASNA